MTRRFAFEPAARETYLTLRKNPDDPLYRALRDVLTELAENPGGQRVRRLRYKPDTWGISVRGGDATWLVLWRAAEPDPEVIEVHYIGPAPGES